MAISTKNQKCIQISINILSKLIQLNAIAETHIQDLLHVFGLNYDSNCQLKILQIVLFMVNNYGISGVVLRDALVLVNKLQAVGGVVGHTADATFRQMILYAFEKLVVDHTTKSTMLTNTIDTSPIVTGTVENSPITIENSPIVTGTVENSPIVDTTDTSPITIENSPIVTGTVENSPIVTGTVENSPNVDTTDTSPIVTGTVENSPIVDTTDTSPTGNSKEDHQRKSLYAKSSDNANIESSKEQLEIDSSDLQDAILIFNDLNLLLIDGKREFLFISSMKAELCLELLGMSKLIHRINFIDKTN
jgi:hypothetical protein